MPLSAAHDSLEAAFPILKESFSPLPISEDLKGLLADLNGIASCDDEAPFLCGRARLAVDASKCRSCGLCLTGCVYGAIHSFSPEIESLDRTGALRYLSGRAVQTLAEDRTGVRVRIQRIHDSEMEEEHFDRVFLAAGAIQSTRVILTSLKRFNEPVSMKDSQKFVLPLLRTRRFPMAWPNTVSLPGLFVEFKVPDVSRHWVHAQVSTVNDYVLQRLGISSRTGALRRKVSAPLYERLLVAWCGIHSDHSSGIELKLSSRRRDDLPVLELRPRLSAEARPTVRRVARYFARHLRRAGTFAMTPALTFAAPGGGSHFGGTLPMSANPRRRLETDTLGRLPEWGRIHVVDGSILPTVPATTVALLQMANADRIASCVEMS
jgi:ferredoxin